MKGEPARRATASLLRGYVQLFPDEAARAIDEASPREAAELLAAQLAPRAAELLGRLSPEQGASILAGSGPAGARRLLERLELCRGAALLARLAPDERTQLLEALAPEVAREIDALAQYPADTAGGLMDPRVAAFRAETPVGHVLARLRRQRARRILDVFVVSAEGRLDGVVSLQDVALAASEAPLGSLIRGPAPHVAATAGREEIVETMVAGGLASLAARAARSALSRRLGSRSGSACPGCRSTWPPPSWPPWWGCSRPPSPRWTALAILLPVVARQSGNSGAQALAVTMRGLVLREIRPGAGPAFWSRSWRWAR